MRRFSLLSLLTAIMLVALVFSHIVTSLELQNLKNTSKVKIFEVVESGPNNGGGGSDIAILIAATLPEEAFELARQNDFSDPWTIYEVGTCKGQMKYDGAVLLRGPYIVGAAVNSRAWKQFYIEFGDTTFPEISHDQND